MSNCIFVLLQIHNKQDVEVNQWNKNMIYLMSIRHFNSYTKS